MPNRICPACGRSTEILVEGLCPECFASRRPLIQYTGGRIEVEACKICGSIRLGNRWVKAGSFSRAVEMSIEHVLGRAKPVPPLEEARLSSMVFETTPDWRTLATVEVEARYQGATIRGAHRVEVLLRPVVCPVCKSRLGGDYDTALRIITDKPLQVEEEILREAQKLGVIDSMVDITTSKREVIVFLLHRGAASRILKALSRSWTVERMGTGTEDVGVSSTGRFRIRRVITVKLKPSPRR